MKKVVLMSIIAIAFVGCGGGGGGGSASEDTSTGNSQVTESQTGELNTDDTATETEQETSQATTTNGKKIVLSGIWEEEINTEYLHPTDKTNSYHNQLIIRHIYKDYDGEYGKGEWETMCSYHPDTVDWNQMASYNGIRCPADYYMFPRSKRSSSMDEQQLMYKNGDFAVIGHFEIDRAYFVDSFSKDKSEVVAENITTPEIVNEVIKVNPSSDNRSKVCSSQERTQAKTKDEVSSNIKFYHHYTKIENGVTVEQNYYPNCISEQQYYSYTKYRKTEIISDSEFRTEFQFGKDDDADAYTSKSHWKKIN